MTFLEQFKSNKNTDSQDLSTNNSGRPLSKISIAPTSKSGRNSPLKQQAHMRGSFENSKVQPFKK
jgi:hypothetical protein